MGISSGQRNFHSLTPGEASTSQVGFLGSAPDIEPVWCRSCLLDQKGEYGRENEHMIWHTFPPSLFHLLFPFCQHSPSPV